MPDPDRIVPVDNAADGIQLGILGPLRIASGGVELEFTSPRSRSFLALLVLNVGRRVSLYEFADAMWGIALPKNPRRAVQLCAVRVRAHLERIGSGAVVVTCPDGYRLDVPPERTDLGRVKDHLREADEAASANDTDGELSAVSAALALWRGEPLADVPSEALQREVAPGLREQWSQLVERRIEIRLRSGNAAELVDELVTLTARHPLREGFCGQLMRALDHCGRRSEALDAYHRFRRRLSEELGTDPSEALRGLHASILTGRADGDRETARLPIPRQLPSGTAAFAGRTGELAALDELPSMMDTTSGPVVGVVTGTAGVGKTTLAIQWARRVADEFVDGQLFADLRGYHPGRALSPHRVQSQFLRTLGVRGEDIPTDPDELTALYRSTLDGRRMLMVLDNVNSADQVRPLLPGTAGCLVVITSRDVLLSLIATNAAHRVNLDLFSITEARELLARRLGRRRLSVEPQAADDIIAASARLPLALAIAAARAVIDEGSRLSALAAQLREGLDAFDTASAMTDVRAVFSWSYRALSADAARLLRLLGLHPGPQLTAPAAASLAALPPRQAERLLDELVRAHLVIQQVPGRYALHDLMREYAVELVTADEAEADRRILDHYLHTAYAATSVLNPLQVKETLEEALAGVRPEPIADLDAAMDWFASEQEVLLSVLDRAVDSGLDRQVWQLVRNVFGYFELRGDWAHWIACQQTALEAAERLGAPMLQAKAQRGLGRAYLRLGRFEDADRHFTTALELNRRHDLPSGEAHVEVDLAMLHEQQGRHAQALEHALRALKLHEGLDNRAGHMFALGTVAWCSAQVGEYQSALDHGRQALAVARELKTPGGEINALDTIGYAHHGLGQFAEAVANYRQSISMARRLGDRFNQAMTLNNLGDTYAAIDDAVSAERAWREAESILDEVGHPAVRQIREKLRASAR